MNKPKRLSGNELVSKLYNFLESNKNLIEKLKITTETTHDSLEDSMFTAKSRSC